MPLALGTRLGPYEILAPLGAGGMGEVYRARDTRLGRDVALKVLSGALADTLEGRARFEREARLLATLNHPRIAAIHGLEDDAGTPVLVMELVEGETLDKRLGRPLPVRQALEIGRQIAEGLEAAHEKGIIHRDLKPSNVKLTPEGKVKLLDFGLAKALEAEGASSSVATLPAPSNDPTGAGVVLGTAPYMSPEQARGEELDRRTDIWSFGCVLYEALAGRRAFPGRTRSEAVAAVLGREPEWKALPAETPVKVHDLLHRCLQKDRVERLRDIGDARIELREAQTEPTSGPTLVAPSTAVGRRRAQLLAGGLGMVALALGVAVGLALRRPTDKAALARPVTRLSLPLPDGTQLPGIVPSVAISRDGTRLALAVRRGSVPELYTRALEGLEWKRLPGTEGAFSPFFSPDGEWVGFFTAGRLNRVSVTGGTPQLVCNVRTSPAGNATGTWGDDGWIVYAGWPAPGLWRCAVVGGSPEQLTESAAAETRPVFYGTPQFLPGGRSLLFGTWTAGHAKVEALSLPQAQRRVLVNPGSGASYAASGHLLYGWDNQILAVPFDPQNLATHGVPVPVVEAPHGAFPSLCADYAVSETGTLVYAAGRRTEKRLVWADRSGRLSPLPLPSADYIYPALSPDGKRVAVGIVKGASRDVWIGDLARGTVSRLTSDGDAVSSLWSPDGTYVVFTSSEPGQYNVFRKKVDGSGPAERLTKSEHAQMATSWSPDGRLLLFSDIDPQTRQDVWLLPLDGERTPRPILKTAATEQSATFSPDGRWIAYESDEAGRFEVYIQAYPGPGEKSQVSTEGGVHASWSTNGRELFYLAGDRLLSVSVDGGARLHLGKAQLLFRVGLVAKVGRRREYDVASDGQRFLFLDDVAPETNSAQLNVVVNWFDELRRRVPIAR